MNGCTGAMVVIAIVLFAVCFIMKLHEWGIHPLRELTQFIHCPWFERTLLLFFICGMVQYAATKGTGSRSGGATEREDSPDASRCEIMRGTNDDGVAVTNLCFTGISISTNSISLSVAWPTNFFPNGTTLDFFAKRPSLTNAWQWFAYCQTLPAETNLSVIVGCNNGLNCPTNPRAMFFKVQDRATCAETMADSDGDGLPDVYELHNNTNPYLSDYALAPKLTVGTNGTYDSLTAALAASTDYSIIEVSSETLTTDQMIVMPSYPVMITGPRDGYSVLNSSANIAAFLMDAGQDSETLFRNFYVALSARSNFQSAFWIGGNLPWSGIGASPTFENVRVRALYPNVLHYGWHYYRNDNARSSISNCTMNAAGSTSAIGIYSYDGPTIITSACAFVNFPSTAGNCTAWIKDGTNTISVLPTKNANLSWAGYALNKSYSTTSDSDGDGLSDSAEIRIHDTDPWLADSDGDGLTDAEEIEAGTNPRDMYSFYRHVTVITTTSDDLTDTTNYVAWGTSALGWETNDITSCWTLPTTNTFTVMSTNGPMYVKSYRDLNRNGQYDSETDIIVIKQVPSLDAISFFTIVFGDVDGDGVADYIEREDATNPYDDCSFRFRALVNCTNTDPRANVTNYFGLANCASNERIAFSDAESQTLYIDTIITNGTCVVSCLRDFDGSGTYDKNADILYSMTLAKSANGTTITMTIGDADADGQSDSSERTHGTNPTDTRNYCFNLTIIENDIICTTNQLTATIYFGTNVVTGPLVLTNRTWEVNVGHLVASNHESVVAYFWDDANSNDVRDAGECYTKRIFSIHGHENVLTNVFTMGMFDRDSDGMPDYWELLHADAGLSPTNTADAFIDQDSDGLINLHEYWMGCNPIVPDGSNTVLSIMARSVDNLLIGKDAATSKGKFFNYVANGWSGIFADNTNFWLHSIDSTCASPWQSNGARNCWAATLITPRHMIGAQHHTSGVGHRYWFVGKSGTIYVRQTIDSIDISSQISTDIRILLLDEELPTNDVSAAIFLPNNYKKYLAQGTGLPMICFDQEEKALVQDVLSLHDGSSRSLVKGIQSSCTHRSLFWEDPVSGDSGNPRFLLLGNQLVIVNMTWFGSGFYGTSLAAYLTEIQFAVDELTPNASYRIRTVDFTPYSELIN